MGRADPGLQPAGVSRGGGSQPYVAETARGHGIGGKLLAKPIAESEADGIWTLQAGIFPENASSIKLTHQRGIPDRRHPFAAGMHGRSLA